MKLDPKHPVESFLGGAGLTRTELGRRMGLPQSAVSAAVARGRGVTLEWLARAAEAAGYKLDVRAARGKPLK